MAIRQPARSVSEDGDQRVQDLEHIVRHFLGDVPLDEENVGRIAANCTARSNEVESFLDANETFDVHFVSRNVACLFMIQALAVDVFNMLTIYSLLGRILALEFL